MNGLARVLSSSFEETVPFPSSIMLLEPHYKATQLASRGEAPANLLTNLLTYLLTLIKFVHQCAAQRISVEQSHLQDLLFKRILPSPSYNHPLVFITKKPIIIPKSTIQVMSSFIQHSLHADTTRLNLGALRPVSNREGLQLAWQNMLPLHRVGQKASEQFKNSFSW